MKGLASGGIETGVIPISMEVHDFMMGSSRLRQEIIHDYHGCNGVCGRR
jgi:hypothetical protein